MNTGQDMDTTVTVLAVTVRDKRTLNLGFEWDTKVFQGCEHHRQETGSADLCFIISLATTLILLIFQLFHSVSHFYSLSSHQQGAFGK